MHEQGKINEVGKRIPHKNMPEPMRTIHFSSMDERRVLSKKLLCQIFLEIQLQFLQETFTKAKKKSDKLSADPQLTEVLT